MSEINDIEETPEGNFPINLKIIAKYQRTEPSLMAKYEYGKYHKRYFCGGSNIDINLIMGYDRAVIPSILQNYVFHWYHTYILHPGMDITEVIISQHFYWPGIVHAVRKEVTTCDTFRRTKLSNKRW